jgi:hypothetical protein
MSPVLPRSPHLEPTRRLAKELLGAHQEQSKAAGERIVQHHSRFKGKTPEQALSDDFSLQDAQLVVAREYGQANWSQLVGVVELMRQVHGLFAEGRHVHVVAKDVVEMKAFAELLRPHYGPDQFGLLEYYSSGEKTESVLARSVRIISESPVLVSEYRTLGLSHLLERRSRPDGPFEVDELLARTRAIVSTSLYSRRPVLLGVKEHEDQSEFDEVAKINTKQLCSLYGSVTEVNL